MCVQKFTNFNTLNTCKLINQYDWVKLDIYCVHYIVVNTIYTNINTNILLFQSSMVTD